MSGLISAAEMAAIRQVAELGLQTDVTIKRLGKVETAVGVEETYTTTGTAKGWLYSTPTPTITVVSGMQALVNTYRLFLAVGTDVRTGDHVVIGSESYTVSDTTAESTWLPLVTVSLRKVE